MLLTLLPLAGWAEELSSASVAVGNVTYGTEAIGAPFVVWEGETLKGPGEEGQQYTVDPKFYTKVGDEYINKGTTLKTLPVGTYYVKITGIPEKGFNGFTYGEFKITQQPLTVTFTDAFKEKLTKTYGQADPAQPAIPAVVETVLQMNDFKVTGLVNDESPLNVLNFGAANAAHYSYTGVNANTYPVTITNVSLKQVETNDPLLTSNYLLTLANDVTFTINKADFSKLGTEQAPAGMTWTLTRTGDASKPYNATALSTNYQVIYRLATAETGGELSANDFKVEYTPIGGEEPDYSLTKKYVGTYKIKVTGLGTNFTGSKEFTTDNYQFAITKASGLQVRVNVLSKTYDGEPFAANQARYTITGAQGEDEIVIADDIEGAGALAAGVGQYNVKAVLTNATIGAEVGSPKVADNYDITAASVTPTTVWTIIKRLATITVTPAEDQTYVQAINYDDVLPTAAGKTLKTEAVEGDRGVIAADVENVKSGYTIGVNADAINAATGSFDYFTVTRNAEVVAVLANYTITTVPGILQINGANLTVQPIVADLVYGTAPSPAISIFNGTTPLQLQAGATPTYVYSKDNANFNLTAADVKNVDRYYVKVDWNSIKDYAPAGYEINADDCISAVFDITKKTIKPTVGNLTLHIGDNISKLQQAGATYPDNTKKPAYDETPEFTFALIANKVDVSEAQATLDKIIGWHAGVEPIENTVANIITLAFANESDAANYTLDEAYVKGDLTLLNTYQLDLADNNLPALIQDADNNGNKYSVKLPARSLKANSWYTMVLPFATTPFELVQKLGVYAVTNLMKAADENKITFKLEFNELPANEPFLIKLAEDKDLSTAAAFTEKDIVYAAEPKIERNNNTFMGVYEAKNIQTTDEQKVGWLATATNSGSSMSNDFKSPKSAPRELVATEAYLIYPSVSSSPVITIEDFDFSNNTTAIKTLNAESMKAIEAEGMYNLNGMKLNSVPTQKGVYIINGKKVVIK